MPSFGENLQREREMRGVTLEEISAATKISVRFLKALEAEEFSTLPSGIFTRSFIRAYSKYLGLDEEHVLAEYQLAAQPQAEVDLNRVTVTKSAPQGGSSRAALLALFLAAAMLLGGYVLYRYSRLPTGVQERVTNPAAASAAPSFTPSPSENTTNVPAAPAVPSGSGPEVQSASASPTQTPQAQTNPSAIHPGTPPSPRTGQGQSDLVLQVAATEQAWVAVSADGKTAFQRILNPREFKTVKAKESFDVVTGNAQGIVLTLNGETLNPLGGHNAYKKIHLTHDDLKNPAP
jgi:cytoskeletal protein RodZ